MMMMIYDIFVCATSVADADVAIDVITGVTVCVATDTLSVLLNLKMFISCLIFVDRMNDLLGANCMAGVGVQGIVTELMIAHFDEIFIEDNSSPFDPLLAGKYFIN